MQQGLGEMRSGKAADLPSQLNRFRDAPAYFGVIKETLATYRVDPDRAAGIAIHLEALIEARKIRDWVGNNDISAEQVKLTRGRLFVHTPDPQQRERVQ